MWLSFCSSEHSAPIGLGLCCGGPNFEVMWMVEISFV